MKLKNKKIEWSDCLDTAHKQELPGKVSCFNTQAILLLLCHDSGTQRNMRHETSHSTHNNTRHAKIFYCQPFQLMFFFSHTHTYTHMRTHTHIHTYTHIYQNQTNHPIQFIHSNTNIINTNKQ